MSTRDKLAMELRKAAQADQDHIEQYEKFARRAAIGEFDEFEGPHICPITQLHAELTAAGFHDFARRVANGEFDATREESEAWAASPEGQATFAKLVDR